jgi:hypothetical protein
MPRYWICEDSAPAEQKASQGLFAIAAGLRDGVLLVDGVDDAVGKVLAAVRASEGGKSDA